MHMRLLLMLLSGLILVMLAPGRGMAPSEAADADLRATNLEAECFRDDAIPFGKMALSTADIELFIVKRNPAPDPGQTPKTVLRIYTQKCLYTILPGNFEPEAMELAKLVEQHSPHVYLMMSPRDMCFPLQDTTPPLHSQNLAPTVQCGATLHGILIEKPTASP